MLLATTPALLQPLPRRHPYVVNFMAICREPPCIVTEYCARGSLAEVWLAGWLVGVR